MLSPFPGMDPYLEGKRWVSFHVELSVEIRRQLSLQLRPKYHVLTMERFITETPGSVTIARRDIYPDTAVIHETMPAWTPSLTPTPVQLAALMPVQIPHYVVEIQTANGQELVMSIEVLSPANKRGKGYLDYLEKREKLLLSDAHFIEIDWLRSGKRLPMERPLPDALYYVFLSQVQKRPILDVWPIQINSTLPTIPVPLLDNDKATLDLQAVFNAVYDSVGYNELIDYSQPPEVALKGETAVIAQALLQKSGIVQPE